MITNKWFEVNKQGLAKLIEHYGQGRLVAELIQNALDEQVTMVRVKLTKIAGRRQTYEIVVEDDSPEGFKCLENAWTLFAESYKKDDPSKRGRFNLGEKLVLAMCRNAEIYSTTGTVEFFENGERRTNYNRCRTTGTVFTAEIKMTEEEFNATCAHVKTLLVPSGVVVEFNDEIISYRIANAVFKVELDTDIADADGVLRRSRRQTYVELYSIDENELPHIYEMGIPVVDIEEYGFRWHVNVQQKIPLNLNRDNVSPAYLRRLFTHAINAIPEEMSEKDMGQPWVTQATSDPTISERAMERFLDLHIGEKRASFDPTDPEANHKFQSEGGVVVYGRQLNAQQWENARRDSLITSAGRLCPTPKPYSDDPDAPPVLVLPESLWTDGMHNVVRLAKFLAMELLSKQISVRIVSTNNNFVACYGGGQLDFNVMRLGKPWFEAGLSESVLDLLIHELGHDIEGDHLSHNYHKALTKLAARGIMSAIEKSEAYKDFAPAAVAF